LKIYEVPEVSKKKFATTTPSIKIIFWCVKFLKVCNVVL